MSTRKRKVKRKNPLGADLPENPEFQEFADFTKRLLKVPKQEIDKLDQQARADKKKVT